jgi:long-chain acyl-CoA synthetase
VNVASSVEIGRRRHPGRPALIFETTAISYQRLDEMANRESNRLAALGIARGDRVALCLPNTPQFVASYLGALKLGAIVVSVNPALAEAEVCFMLNDSGAAHVVRDPDLWRDDDQPASGVTAIEMASTDPAVIVYTGGTTGGSKGATLSHGNVVFTMESKRRYLRIRPEDRMLLFLPLFHCFGQNAILNAGLHSGATLVLHRTFDKARILESIARDRVTILCGVPAKFAVLCDAASPEQLIGVRYFMSAAAPLPLELETRWQAKFGQPIHQGYGLTETSPFASYNHPTLYRPGSIGVPIDGVEMAIADIDTGKILSAGAAGEIVIKGPNVMLGYWNRPDATSEAIRDGWFRTGDIGHIDADGYFFIEDRLKDMIIVGGYNVYPAEVENALYHHAAVSEAAAFGVPNPVLGERVRAAVTLRRGASATGAELIAGCRAHIADYKLPVEIDFVPALPKSRVGKVLKRVLRDEYCETLSKASLPDGGAAARDAADLERRMIGWIAASLGHPAHSIHPGQAFADFGFTSLAAVELAGWLGRLLGRPVAPTVTWEYSTPRSLASHLMPAATPDQLLALDRHSGLSRLAEEVTRLSEEEAEALLLAELDTLS